MSSSSNDNIADQYWYSGSNAIRDVSDYILFKKRQGIRQLLNKPVRPSVLQTVQNRTSYQFAVLDCRAGCISGGFPRVRLT